MSHTEITRICIWQLVFLMLLAQSAFAQRGEEADRRPRLTRFRYNEPWDYVTQLDREALLWPEQLKHRPFLGNRSAPTLSFGSEMRTRYELLRNPDGSSVDEDRDGYLWNRILPYMDVQDTAGLYRVFTQFNFAYVADRDPIPEAFDEDRADFLQLFTDLQLLNCGDWRLRLGRQIIGIGSERLVSTRYGINVIRSFDSAELSGELLGSTMRALYARPVEIRPGAFDNRSSDEQQLWGVHFSRPAGPQVGTLEYYYLGFSDKVARFDQGVGQESRHSIGLRSFGERDLFRWNTEAVLQFGRFAGDDILAWTSSIQVSRQLPSLPLQPTLDLKFDVISGDSDPNDGTLGTFNPLFPSLKYFGEAGVFAPYNLIDLHPALIVPVGHKSKLNASIDFLWRYSDDDALYGPGGRIIRSGNGSDARYVGTQYELLLETEWNYGLQSMISYSVLPPGRFIKETGPSETIHFLALELLWKF